MTRRIYDLTGDEFESTTQTLELNVFVQSDLLLLPKRCTSITTVKTRFWDGTLTTQLTSVYRLRSSLDATGSIRQDNYDCIAIIPYSGGLSAVLPGPGGTYSVYQWPYGVQTVQVTGAFGWLVTPFDIKRALANLVWDHYKQQRGDLGRARQANINGQQLTFVPDTPGETGIVEVDQVLRDYQYDTLIGV